MNEDLIALTATFSTMAVPRGKHLADDLEKLGEAVRTLAAVAPVRDTA